MSAAQPNITSVGTLLNLTLDMGGTGLNIPSLKFNGTTFNQAYFINITEGGADPSKAVVLNSTKDFNGIRNLTCSGTITGSTGVSTPSLSCDTVTATTLNINPITLQLRGTTLTSSASELNALEGVSPGTASNSKALVLGSTGNISGINALSTASVSTSGGISVSSNINGVSSYGNQTAITTVDALTELGINTTVSTEYLRIQASGSAYLNGSYTRTLSCFGSNATPVQFQIEVNNGTKATSSNASWIGNLTAHDHRFGTNNTTNMFLLSNGRVGIGTTSPTAGLQVTINVS
ncbi:hypothetical protein PC110_g8927 [Phytophthora cactorum]|uniref:Uncharacterized protein n=1 Tax=Phytophthora cactorum TaxID=29920 RepID=A0A329SFC1_9STRA|nr:hypothetical protein PC110_g8927 [Phytophthora cactorum]